MPKTGFHLEDLKMTVLQILENNKDILKICLFLALKPAHGCVILHFRLNFGSRIF
jgi:hypothetical protein